MNLTISRTADRKNFRFRAGLGLADAIAACVVLGILIALCSVRLLRDRAVARQVSCQNNLRNLGLAIFDYHQIHRQLPLYGTGTHDSFSGLADEGDAGTDRMGGSGGGNNGKRLSYLVGLLPHIDQQTLWETINEPSTKTVNGELGVGSSWNPMGPAPTQRAYPPWETELSILRCPSDPRNGEATGRNNYAACLGDSIDCQMDSGVRFDEDSKRWKLNPLIQKRIDAAARGAFVYRQNMKLSDISDGLSNTILLAEIMTSKGDGDCRTSPLLGLGEQTDEVPVTGGLFETSFIGQQQLDPERPRFWNQREFGENIKLPTRADEFRGMRWADARTVHTGFTTILPPNSILQVAGNDVGGPTVAPPGSNHHGGIFVLLADGSIQFYTDSIECGDLWSGSVRLGMKGPREPGSPSPYGLWGALGTRAAKD